MRYSAQAIIVDKKGITYLEDNPVIGALSFIGGKVEGSETPIQTVQRELKEELGLNLTEDRFLEPKKQEVQEFWNSRERKNIQWCSTYFVLILEEEDIRNIKAKVKLITCSLLDLEQRDIDSFPQGRKERFLKEVRRALSHI